MDDATADRYLGRIGSSRPDAVDHPSLAILMQRHLLSVPFENLSIHLEEPIMLDEAALVDKIVCRRRGGFCYELNGALALLLRHLGFDVTLLAARVFSPRGLGPPFDHLALRVQLDEPWLVDVGFGRFARRPLRLDERTEQEDVEGSVLISDVDGDLMVTLGGEPQYRLETKPRELADFGPTCWWQQTSPDSHFTQSLTCSLPTDRGRVTLSGRRLITTVDGHRHEQVLESDDDVRRCYRDVFGIALDRLPITRSHTA